MRLYSIYDSIEFQEAFWKLMNREYKDFDDYEKQYGWVETVGIGTFFEGISVFLMRRLANIQLVDDLFTTPIKLSCKKIKPLSGGQQKTLEFSSSL